MSMRWMPYIPSAGAKRNRLASKDVAGKSPSANRAPRTGLQDVVVDRSRDRASCAHARPSLLRSRSEAVITMACVSSDMPIIGAIDTRRWVATDCASV